MSFIQRFFLFLGVFVAFASASRAVTLDWDSQTWVSNYNPDGTLAPNSYEVDGTKAGNDITVTVSGNIGQLTTDLYSPNPMTPAIVNTFQGGLTTAQNTLCLAVNFANQSQSVTVTVDFSALYTAGVQNVSFTLFDIDLANTTGNHYQDQLRNITATSITGALVAPTITTSANNTLTGSPLTYVVNGTASTNDVDPGSGLGNVTISFGTNAIKSFTFTYGSGTNGGSADPTFQHVGIHDITFLAAVPEVNPAWGAIGSCLVAAALILRHGAKFRK
jgi:hypothetical protein